MVRIIILFSFIGVFFLPSFGQAGFLGSLNSIEVNVHLAPSIRYTNSLKNNEEEGYVSIKRLRVFNPSYSLDYSRILKRNSEISIGFKYARQRSFSSPLSFQFDDATIIDDLIMHQGGLNFKFKKYFPRSFATLGKYISLNIDVSRTKIKANQDLNYTFYFFETSSFFLLNKNSIGGFGIKSNVPEQTNNAAHLSLSYGKNVPLKNNLLFNFGVTIPLFSIQFNEFAREIGYFTNSDYKNGKVTSSDYTSALFNTFKMYNGIRLETGLKYFF
jgi:hypothetical protein